MTKKQFIAILAATVASCSLGTGAATATGAETHHSGPYCASIVSKELDTTGHSKVVAESCSNRSVEDAHAKAKQIELGLSPNSAVSLQSDTLLLNEYKHANYDTLLYSFWGTGGPCDSDGYHLYNFVSVATEVSSMRGYNNCNSVAARNSNLQWGYIGLDSPYVGDAYNDDVRELQVYHG
ncbi:hypothetical protein [Streptomyces sp. NPDC059928]|uniref:hypothetical protein n=1 Tax=unclassified Streptomyces TaxID=2593676 RepID=UPI00365BDBBD